jgi:hypothetical protein
MSRRNSLLAGILALLALVGSATSSGSQTVWLVGDGPPSECRLISDDLWPAWLCVLAATHRTPAPATWSGHSAKADVLLPGTTITRRPGA